VDATQALTGKRWLSIGEAALLSGISERGLRRMISAGRLTPHRPTPRRVLLDREQLDKAISASAEPAPG
jgi:excisionase family DNA binding protein